MRAVRQLRIATWTILAGLVAANSLNALGIIRSGGTERPDSVSWLGLVADVACIFVAAAGAIAALRMFGRLDELTSLVRSVVEDVQGTAATGSSADDEIGHLSEVVTKLRDASQRVLTSEANLSAAVENMVEGIVMISADGKVALHNQRLLTIFGLPPMNAVGLPRAKFNEMLVGALKWPQSAVDYLQQQLAAVRVDGQYRVFDIELPNDRVLRYSASVLADGNVMSYIEDISDQRAAAASILRLAHFDTLTELPNRALFHDKLAAAVAAASLDPNRAVALLLCDLDRFKAVNDTFGHPVGDELLRQVTQRMQAAIRADDVFARLGGDEFAIILVNAESRDLADDLAPRLVGRLGDPFDIGGRSVSVGLSVGIACVPQDALTVDELMQRADLALYAAKRGGRSMHKFYEPAMSMLVDETVGLEAALRKAIDQNELHMAYQPQVDLRTRRVVGFEALARWSHPERGVISPGVFIPVAERTGLIIPLGAWALRQACQDAANWPDVTIAVNVAPQQILVGDFVGMVRTVLRDTGLPAERLELEITESAPLQSDDALLGIFSELQAMGVRFSMDDFGTGNSALNYLQKFSFNQLKIDQSFIRRLAEWKEAEVIVSAIVGMSSALGVETVAEGIETERQAEILQSMGCAKGQGWVFGRPAPASAAVDLLMAQQVMIKDYCDTMPRHAIQSTAA